MTSIGLGASINTVAEFNRRAAIALKGVECDRDTRQGDFIRRMIQSIEAGRPISDKQQLYLFQTINRFRRQITDQLVLDYAAERTGEYA